MRTPTLHTNGTSYEGLLDPLQKASDSVRDAITDLQECAPHGRDYYPQGDGAFHEAEAEHLSRIGKLVHVREEIENLIASLAEAKVGYMLGRLARRKAESRIRIDRWRSRCKQ